MDLAGMVKEGAILGSLTSSSLLGILVVALAGVAWHLYKILHAENKKQLGDLLEEQKKSNTLIKEQTLVYKAANEGMSKFIETHCAKTNEKLDDIEDALKDIDNKLNVVVGEKGYSLRNKE
ncbi:hypothetical protein [Campylobacter sp. VTCC 70190]|uniref:hypothetical protein n=1 Tax=Campylobacter sp. VTCC 70190 TaxID=3392118 RepID=UPI00398F15D5